MNSTTDPTSAVVVAIGQRCAPAPAADDWFDARTELGRGYRYLPDATQYLLAAARRAGITVDDSVGDQWGVCIASTSGSVRLHDHIERSVAAGEAHLLSPTLVPHFSHNLLASRLAMEHGITGMCLSVHTPVTAGLDALTLATVAIDAGRAATVLAGGVEAPRLDGNPGAQGAMVLALTSARNLGPDTAALARIMVRSFPIRELAQVLEDTAGRRTLLAADDRTAARLRHELPGCPEIGVASCSLAVLRPLLDLIADNEAGATIVATDDAVTVASVRPIDNNDPRHL